MFIEIAIKLKTESATYVKKFLHYEELELSCDNPIIQSYLQECLEEFKVMRDEIDTAEFKASLLL